MSDRATIIAKNFAKQYPESYYEEPFVPHRWVVEAIDFALNSGFAEAKYQVDAHFADEGIGAC